MLLADQLAERLRPIPPGDDDVLAAAGCVTCTRLVPRNRSWRDRRSRCSERGIYRSSSDRSAAGERPPHKETQAYGCCVSTLTRFARPPSQRPLTGSRSGDVRIPARRRACTVVRRWRSAASRIRGTRIAANSGERLPHHQFSGHFARQRLVRAADRDRHACPRAGSLATSEPVGADLQPRLRQKPQELGRLVGHPRHVEPLARRAVGQPLDRPSPPRCRRPSESDRRAGRSSDSPGRRRSGRRANRSPRAPCSRPLRGLRPTRDRASRRETARSADAAARTRSASARPAVVSRTPSYGVYVARLLSSSVLSMLVTVPGSTPSAAAICPVATAASSRVRELIDRFDVIFDRQTGHGRRPLSRTAVDPLDRYCHRTPRAARCQQQLRSAEAASR